MVHNSNLAIWVWLFASVGQLLSVELDQYSDIGAPFEHVRQGEAGDCGNGVTGGSVLAVCKM